VRGGCLVALIVIGERLAARRWRANEVLLASMSAPAVRSGALVVPETSICVV
jgi:hypothetical protein